MALHATRLSGQRTDSLDAARGICALLVVLFHGLLVFRVDGVDNPHALPLDLAEPWLLVQHLLLGIANGPAYVTFFFVLSGTVLALSLSKGPPMQAGAVLGYLIRRGFRLYPLLLVAAGLGALLQFHFFGAFQFPQATSWLNDSYKIAAGDVPAEFIANAQGRSASLNGPAWSIKVEILASAVFPALFLLTLTARRAALAALLLGAAMFVIPVPAEQLHYMNVFLICFFIGASLPRWGKPVAAGVMRLAPLPRRLVLLVLLLVFLFSRRLLGPDEFAPPLVVLLETFGAAVGVALLLHGRDHAFFATAPMRLLARLSFGIYLLHVILMSVLAHAVLPLLPGQIGASAALGFGLLLSLATICVTVPVAWVLHGTVERPMQQFGRSLSVRLAERSIPRRRAA